MQHCEHSPSRAGTRRCGPQASRAGDPRGGRGGVLGVARGLPVPRRRCWREVEARRRLQGAHVGALRLERRVQRRRPSPRPRRGPLRRPRPSARSGTRAAPSARRPRSSRRARPARGARTDQRHRPRVEVLAARLVQAVVEAGRDEVPVPAREAEHQQRGVRDVEDRVAHRDLGRQRRARLLRPHGGVRHDERRPPGRSAARSGPPGRRRTRRTRPAARRRRCPDGPRARSRARAGRCRARRGGRPPAAPRRTPRRSTPARPTAGCRSAIRNVKRSGGCSRAKPRTARLRRSRAICRSVSTAKRPVSSTSSVMWIPTAAAKVSKPGPEVRARGGDADQPPAVHAEDRLLDRVERRLARHDRRPTARAPSAGPSARGR